MKQRTYQPRPRAGWALAAIALVTIAGLTIIPGGAAVSSPRRFLLLAPAATDVLYNVVLFLPLGAGLALAGVRTAPIALVGALTSTAIEFIQWRWIPARYSSLADIASNTAGAWLGALLLTAVIPGLIRPDVTTARRAASLFGLGWLTVNLGGAALLRLDVPRTPAWWGQWAHVFASTVPLAGQVFAVDVNGIEVPDDSIANTHTLQLSARDQGLQLSIAAVGLTEVPGRAQVAALADGRGNLIVAAEQERCTLRLVDRRLGESYGFRMLALNLPASCSAATDTVWITTSSTDRTMVLQVRAPSGIRADSLRVTPAQTWRLIAPIPRSINASWAWTAAWIVAFIGPLALFGQVAAPGAAGPAGGLAVGAGAMLVASAVAGLASPGAWELFVVSLAVLLGSMAGRLWVKTRPAPRA